MNGGRRGKNKGKGGGIYSQDKKRGWFGNGERIGDGKAPKTCKKVLISPGRVSQQKKAERLVIKGKKQY